jgi:hypothetical protein
MLKNPKYPLIRENGEALAKNVILGKSTGITKESLGQADERRSFKRTLEHSDEYKRSPAK